jgi:hypothetical protein
MKLCQIAQNHEHVHFSPSRYLLFACERYAVIKLAARIPAGRYDLLFLAREDETYQLLQVVFRKLHERFDALNHEVDIITHWRSWRTFAKVDKTSPLITIADLSHTEFAFENTVKGSSRGNLLHRNESQRPLLQTAEKLGIILMLADVYESYRFRYVRVLAITELPSVFLSGLKHGQQVLPDHVRSWSVRKSSWPTDLYFGETGLKNVDCFEDALIELHRGTYSPDVRCQAIQWLFDRVARFFQQGDYFDAKKSGDKPTGDPALKEYLMGQYVCIVRNRRVPAIAQPVHNKK